MNGGVESLCDRPAVDVVSLLRSREVSALEVVDAVIARTEERDGAVNALPVRAFETARATAKAMDEETGSADTRTPLSGLPVAVKDQFDVAGLPTSQGFAPFANRIADEDDISVATLRSGRGIVYAKTNMPELGFGGHSVNRLYGPTRNPWNPNKTAGGSSGGAAAALAAGMAWLATGSDLGGSLRIPAAFCGVVGLRPTPGMIATGPRPLPFDRLSVCGPMARSVTDVALLFDAMADSSDRDPLSARGRQPQPSALLAATEPPDLGQLSALWSPDLNGLCQVEPAIAAVCEDAVRRLQAAGVSIEHCAVPFVSARDAVAIHRGRRLLALEQSLDEHARSMPDRLRIESDRAHALTLQDMAKADLSRAQLWRDYRHAMQGRHLLLCPATTTEPFEAEAFGPVSAAGQACDCDWFLLTHVLSLLSAPVISLPCGRTKNGLPVGLQLVGWPGGDIELIAVAASIERILGVDCGTWEDT